MTEKGTTIVYRNEICRVVDIKPMTLGKISREYYVLSPVYDTKNTIYVPADNQNLTAKMRKLLTVDEIYAVIDTVQENKVVWIDDDRERNIKFKQVIEKGDSKEIIGMIAAIFEHKLEVEKQSKKLHSADEMLLERAEKVIYEEIALVLGIAKEDVVSFIMKRLEK